jgi:hypothetical protein
MKLFKYIFLILLTQAVLQPLLDASDSVITFFIKEKQAPVKKIKNNKSTLISAPLHQPSFIKAIGKDRSWLNQPGVDGLHAIYLGYLAISDHNGQISFPRQQQNDTIYLLVTPEIEPEFMMSPSLIHGWITKNHAPAAYYEINRKHNKELKTYYFDVRKIENPQEIKNGTITIFAHPDHIHVPVGISLNTYSTNIILPELQATKVDTIKNSLYTLSIKQYFEHITIENKKDTLNIAAMILNQ